MAGTAADVIRIAKGEVGYHEGKTGTHWNNKQKYSPAVPTLEWSQNQAWCATFCSWVALEAGVASLFPRTASCAAGVQWFKQKGRFSEYPAIGAQVFFGTNGGTHTGLVWDFDADYIFTVEGNTNNSGSAEGDGVYLKKRARRDAYVFGYGYPAYAAGIVSADPSHKNPTPPVKETSIATTDTRVKALYSNLSVIGSLVKPKETHAAGYYLAHTEKAVADLTAKVTALTALVEKKLK